MGARIRHQRRRSRHQLPCPPRRHHDERKLAFRCLTLSRHEIVILQKIPESCVRVHSSNCARQRAATVIACTSRPARSTSSFTTRKSYSVYRCISCWARSSRAGSLPRNPARALRNRRSSSSFAGGRIKMATAAGSFCFTCSAPCTSISRTRSRPLRCASSSHRRGVPYRCLPKTRACSRNSPWARPCVRIPLRKQNHTIFRRFPWSAAAAWCRKWKTSCRALPAFSAPAWIFPNRTARKR